MRRVLIIDDHEPSRKTLVATLTQSGYEIAGEGSSGSTAVALATTTGPDIVLLAVGTAGSRRNTRCAQYHARHNRCRSS